MPEDLKCLVEKMEESFQNEVVILETPSRFGVHAYVATFLDPVFELQPRGGGASLNSKNALERSLYELIQTHHQMDGQYVENSINQAALKNNSLIRNFMQFDVHKMMSHEHHLIDFVDNSNAVSTLRVDAALEKLVELIYKHSSLLINRVYENKNGLSCARVIIPEADEFFLGTHYFQLQPKPATASYIKTHLGREFSWDGFLQHYWYLAQWHCYLAPMAL